MTLCVIYKPTFGIAKQHKFMHILKHAMTLLTNNWTRKYHSNEVYKYCVAIQTHSVHVDKTQKGDLYKVTKYRYNFKSLNETLTIRYENTTNYVTHNTCFSIAKLYDKNRVHERIILWLTTNLPSNDMRLGVYAYTE